MKNVFEDYRQLIIIFKRGKEITYKKRYYTNC